MLTYTNFISQSLGVNGLGTGEVGLIGIMLTSRLNNKIEDEEVYERYVRL